MENKVAPASAEFVMYQKRRHPRYLSQARAVIYSGIKCLVETAALKDICHKGCCVTFGELEDENIKKHGIYVIHIYPENERIEKFNLFVHCRWIRSQGDFNECGFAIISSPCLYLDYKYHCRRKRA